MMNGLLDVQPGSEVPGHSSDMIGQSVPASKKRICRGRGSQRIQSEACAANAVAKKGQRTHVVGGLWSFSSGVSKKGLCGHNSHVLTLMGTTPLDQPTPPMLRGVLLLTLQSATTTTSDLTTTHWSGRKVQGRANGFC